MGNTQEPEFPMQLNLAAAIRTFSYSKLFITPRYPTDSFAGKTVIVTGSNVGLEDARDFYRSNATRLIIMVHAVSKGQATKEDILKSVAAGSDADAIEVWLLDLRLAPNPRSSFASAPNGKEFRIVDGYEQVTQFNVLNTFVLALSLLPKLRGNKAEFPDAAPHSSEAHRPGRFDEINATNLYELFEVLLVREIVARPKHNSNSTAHQITINLVNPGICYSAINRSGVKPPLLVRLQDACARTNEVGGWCLVLAAAAPHSSPGECQSDGKNQDVAPWIYTSLGEKAPKEV